MQIASGKVVDGRVELDGELPEGASVTVIARDDDETFEADPETEKMLLDAIAQCERGRHDSNQTVALGTPPSGVSEPLAIVVSALAAAVATRSKYLSI